MASKGSLVEPILFLESPERIRPNFGKIPLQALEDAKYTFPNIIFLFAIPHLQSDRGNKWL